MLRWQYDFTFYNENGDTIRWLTIRKTVTFFDLMRHLLHVYQKDNKYSRAEKALDLAPIGSFNISVLNER